MNFYTELIAELKRLTGIDITVSQEEVGAGFYATVIALIKAIGSIGGLSIPEGYNFNTITDRDNYFSSALDELVLEKTYIWIRTDNSLQLWNGETNPVIYDNSNWEDRTGFIRGDKGDSGSVGQGVNTGGATNQVLKKLSPANYDTDWGNITNAPNNSILIASGGDLADSGRRFNDLGITVADIWSANKVISQIDSQVAKTLSIEGNWNASTNTPNLDGILEGDTYIVEVAGINYGDTYEVNDWIVKTDTGYAKINNNLATVVFSAIGGSPLDNPALVLEFDKYINKISTISTGNIPKITADGQIEDSTYSVSDLFTKDLTDYTEKTTTLSNNDKVLVFDESTGLWKYSRIDKIPSSNSSTLKVSDTDTIEGYLIDKLIGTTNYIILTKVNAGAEEQIQIEIGSNVFDKSTNTTDDITEGTTNLLLTQAERTLIGVLVNNGDGLSYLTNDGTYKRVSWGDIDGILSNQTDLQGALNLKEDIANKNKANGYVGLDANAKIDISYIPNSALERLIIVADETARFALTPTTAQNGDVVKQQDTDIMFYIVDDTNLSNSSGYEEFAVGTAGAVEWSNILNKPIDIFHTGTNTTDDITEGNTNLFDKEVVFTGGNNVTITGTYPNFEIQDNTMSQTDIQNALDDKLKSAGNLTDVADQQTALNNITAVSGATDEYVLTKDTTTGNAQWKVSSDELTKVSANDTTTGYLEDKIVGTTNKITVTTLDDGSNEDLQIDIGTDIFDKSINTMDDVTDGTTYVKTENNLTDTLKTNYDSAYTHSTTTTGNPHSVTKTDVGLGNVVNVDTSNPANITWTESYRTVTDTEKTTWNGKQNALGYTAENSANKKTVWQATPDNTSYPSEKLVKDSIDLKVDKVTGKQLSTEDYTTAEKTKLSGIATGANNYVHPTGDGNSHIPVTGITNNGKILKAGATANSASWGNVDWSEVVNKPTSFTPTSHNHAFSEITSKPTTLSGYGITDANSEKWSTVTVSGDADKYYPVVFSITGEKKRTIEIKKNVHDYASWDGALTLEIDVQSAGYGGYAGYTNIKRLLHSNLYAPVKYFVASVSQSINTNSYLIIWLLGGGRTYTYKKNLETDQNPIVYYSLTTLGGDNGTVNVKTAVDSTFYKTNIVPADSYNFVKNSDVVTTATANKILKLDENAKLPASITGNADGNSATATKLQTAKTINGVGFDGSADITINAIDSTSRIASTEKGAVNGVATLDNTGRVPSSQLPSYVDDVLEYANVASFPVTGEASKIYVALNVNLAYRWGGSNYVEISPSIALGETSTTAYRGDRGKIAYDHSQLTGGTNPHNTTFANIGTKPTTVAGYGITDGVTLTDTQTLTNKTISSPVITGTPAGITATHVGLGNVTNNAQVKKIASSTDNAIMRWDGTTGDMPQDSLVTISDTGTVNVVAGQNYNINGVALKNVSETLTNKTLTTPVLNTEVTGTGVTTTGEANKLFKFSAIVNTILHFLRIRKSSTTALNVQNDSSVDVLNVDTTNKVVTSYNQKVSSLAGIGSRMVVADSTGNLSASGIVGSVTINNGTGNNALLGLTNNAGVLSLRNSSSAENIRLDSSTAKVRIGNATSTELNALTWQDSRLSVYDSIGIQNNATLPKAVFFSVGSEVDSLNMINLVRQNGDTIFRQGVRSDGEAMVFGDSNIERFSINKQKFIDYVEEGINGKLYVGRYNGIATSPTAIVSGDIVGTFGTKGQYGTTKYNYAIGGVISFVAAGNYVSATNAPTDLVVSLTTTTTFGAEKLRLTSAGNLSVSGYISNVRGANVASATTITPSGQIFHLTGTTEISTINIPYAGFNGTITIIPDGAFTTTTAGNIALETTAVANRALTMTYDSTTSKWYPSY